MLRVTHTFVDLEITGQAYQEIRGKLEAADYGHLLDETGRVHMTGIALIQELPAALPVTLPETGCHNCEFGREAAAMLIVRCRNPTSSREGRPVELDEVHPCWTERKEETNE